jgi:predicted MPP superfamily phosphohydrolase
MKILLLNDTHCGFGHNTSNIHRKFFQRISKEEFDVVVHAGDMAITRQSQVEASFKSLRKLAGDRPVLVVRGNHDYWQDDRDDDWLDFYALLEQQRKWASEYNVTLLDEGNTYETDKVLIGGFPTWYKDSKPSTNDYRWMDNLTPDGLFMGEYLQGLEHSRLKELSTKLENSLGKARVVVSHMPIFGDDRDQRFTSSFANQFALKGNCEYYLCGHSHRKHEGELYFWAKTYQTGSDYDKPKHLVVEVT